jgi:hypothetical protein
MIITSRLSLAYASFTCRCRFDDVLGLVVNQCARYFEEGFYLLPQEKHSLLRSMAYGLSLMDSDTDKINVFKSKKINLSPFQKFFKVFLFLFHFLLVLC